MLLNLPTAPDGTPLFVYSLVHEKYILRSATKWLLDKPVGKDALKYHLMQHGFPGSAVTQLMKIPETHQVVYGAEMKPNQPPLYEDENGCWIMNTWTPPTLTPAAGVWPIIEMVLDRVTAGDAEGKAWLIHWIARKVQNPELVPKVAVVLATAQGAGKNFVANLVFEMLGPHNTATVSQGELESGFNSRWIDKLFVFGDEVLASDNRKDISQKLKILIDGKELEHQAKYSIQKAIKSRLAWMFASNDPVSPLVLENSDRRYSVFSNYEPLPNDYKGKLEGCFEADRKTPTAAFRAEMQAFFAYLLELEVDVARVSRPYSNASRQTLIEASKPSHETFYDYVQEHGVNGLLDQVVARNPSAFVDKKKKWDFGEEGIQTEVLYRCYEHFCTERGQHKMAMNRLMVALNNRPEPWKKQRLTYTDSSGKIQRANCYRVPRVSKQT